MRRSTFKSKASTRKPRDPDRTRPTPTVAAGSFRSPLPVEGGVGAPKEAVKAKPGKQTPNAEERMWMNAIVAHGCIACILDGQNPRPTAVHHILRGGQRIGHLFTLPLCQPGHHMDGDALDLISRHPWKARFEAKYGSEMELLSALQMKLNGQTSP